MTRKNSAPMPRVWAVIPAAGVGKRFGADRPKQYLPLAGETLIAHSISTLLDHSAVDCVIVALHPDDRYFSQLDIALNPKVRTAEGGAERADSVEKALLSIASQAQDHDWVLVHDAARPCLNPDEVSRLLANCEDYDCGAILALPVVDTIKRVEHNAFITATENRDQLWRALTPQLFRYRALLNALMKCRVQGKVVTDEASAMEQQGFTPNVIRGDASNIKVTHPDDLALAAYFLSQRKQS